MPTVAFTMMRHYGTLKLYGGTGRGYGPWYPSSGPVGERCLRTLYDLAEGVAAITATGNFGGINIPTTGWPGYGDFNRRGTPLYINRVGAEHSLYPSWGPLTLTVENTALFDIVKNFIHYGICGPQPLGGYAAIRHLHVFPADNPDAYDA